VAAAAPWVDARKVAPEMAMATAPARADAPISVFCDMMFSLDVLICFRTVVVRQENHDELSHHLEIKRTLSAITWA
jgi:hypothetical protein